MLTRSYILFSGRTVSKSRNIIQSFCNNVYTQANYSFSKFTFSPSRFKKNLSNYELLINGEQSSSQAAKDLLQNHGILQSISIRDVKKQPLSKPELRLLRQKLQLSLDNWTEPPVFEDTAAMTLLYDRIIDGVYDITTPILFNKANTPHLTDDLSITVDEENEAQSLREGVAKQSAMAEAIVGKPVDRILNLLREDWKTIERSNIGDDDAMECISHHRHAVDGDNWHKVGSKYYDADHGMNWDHVQYQKYQFGKQQKIQLEKDKQRLQLQRQNNKRQQMQSSVKSQEEPPDQHEFTDKKFEDWWEYDSWKNIDDGEQFRTTFGPDMDPYDYQYEANADFMSGDFKRKR